MRGDSTSLASLEHAGRHVATGRRSTALGIVGVVWALLTPTACGDGPTTAAAGGRVLWRVDGRGWGTPAADSGEAGAAYFLTYDHALVAVGKADGRVRWRASLNPGSPYYPSDEVAVAARAGPHGVVGAMDSGALYAFDRAAGGARLYAFLAPGNLGLDVYMAGDSAAFYVSGSRAKVYGVDAATGALRWATTVDSAAAQTTDARGPRVHDGAVYVGLQRAATLPVQGAVAAVDAATGVVRWVTSFAPDPTTPSLGTGCVGQAVFTPDGGVVVTVDDGRVFALDPATGAVRWTAPRLTEAQGGGYPSPDMRHLAAAGGTVVVGSNTGIVVGLDAATGAERWRNAPSVASDIFAIGIDATTAYLVDGGSVLRAFDLTSGRQRWTASVGGSTTGFTWGVAADGARVFANGIVGHYALRRD